MNMGYGLEMRLTLKCSVCLVEMDGQEDKVEALFGEWPSFLCPCCRRLLDKAQVTSAYLKRAEKWLLRDGSVQILRWFHDRGLRYVQAGSYGMRVIREPRDRDVIVHEDDWRDFARVVCGWGWKVRTAEYGQYCVKMKQFNLEFFRGGHPKGFGYQDLLEGPYDVYDKDEDGLWSWSLEHTIMWKEAMGRDKDKRDLRRIKKWLKNGGR
jgi:hypothetical protein